MNVVRRIQKVLVPAAEDDLENPSRCYTRTRYPQGDPLVGPFVRDTGTRRLERCACVCQGSADSVVAEDVNVVDVVVASFVTVIVVVNRTEVVLDFVP